MDNVTHGLFGYALARAMPIRGDGAAAERERSAFVWTSVLASNAPDLDLLVNFFVTDPKLAYLVHHRGHTHTLLWALPLGALFGFAVAALHRLPDRRARWRVTGLGALAGAMHILFDAFNNYGVHPFHPLDSHWYYGDAVFIVEPLLLVAMIPLVACGARTRVGRGIGWLLAVALAWLLLAAGVLPLALGGVLVGLLVLALGLFWRLGLGSRTSLVAVAVLVAGMFGASQLARARMAAALTAARPGERVLDIARSPYPGNPLCWNAAIVSVDEAGGYHGRRADLSLVPKLWPVTECQLRPAGRTTAPSVPGTEHTSGGFTMHAEFAAPTAELRGLWRGSCRAAAALRFLRAPFWTGGPDAAIGDLRYDREPGLGFAEIPLAGPCDDPVAGWVPPRMELLE